MEVLNEREFTKQVIDLARMHGWRVVHFLPGQVRQGKHITTYMGDGPGFPDIVAVRDRLLMAELKIPPNKIEGPQVEWAGALEAAHVEWYLWTPADLEDIQRVFARRGPI